MLPTTLRFQSMWSVGMSFAAASTWPSLSNASENASSLAIARLWASPSLRKPPPRQTGDCVYESSTQPLDVSHPVVVPTTQPCALPMPWNAISQLDGHGLPTPLTTTVISPIPYIQQRGPTGAAPPAARTASLNGGTSSGPPQRPWSSTPPGIAIIFIVLILFLVVVAILYWSLCWKPRKRREAAISAELVVLPPSATAVPPAEKAESARISEQRALFPVPKNGIPLPPAPNNGVPPSPHHRRPKRPTTATNETTKSKVKLHPNGGITVKQTTTRTHSNHGKHDSGLGESPARPPQWPHQRAFRSPPPSPTRGRRRCELPGEPDFADYRQAAFSAESVNAVHQQRIRRERPADPLLARGGGGDMGREVPGGYPPSPPRNEGRNQPAPVENAREERRYMEWGFHLAGRIS